MKLWEQFISLQEEVLGKKNTDRWLRSLKVLRFDARNLYLEAEDAFHVHWFEQHVRKLLGSLRSSNGKEIHIHLSTPKDTKKEKRKKSEEQESFQSDSLLPDKRFSSFYISEENKLTCTVLENLDPSFNPIFLYGPKGSGKTHLLMSVADALKKQGFRTFYIRAETFTSHVVRAIQFGSIQYFRKLYRSIDALIFDDIDILAGKIATQEEFFHTFNELHTAGKRIILSSPSLAQELTGIEPRLISRFEWGICLGLALPSKQDLKEILRKKAAAFRRSFSEKQLQFLVQSFPSPFSVYQAFDALILRNPPKNACLEEVLFDFLEKEKKQAITEEILIEKTAEMLGRKKEDLLGKSQQKEICLARNIAMYLIRKHLQLPFMKIGKLFAKDHSTVMSAVKSMEKRPPDMLREIEKSLQF